MHASFDEVRRMAFRALDAGGAAAGVDEDSAYAIAWLEAAGLEGCKTLADALDETAESDRAEGAQVISRDAAQCEVEGGGRSAVFYAPCVIDLAAGLAEGSRDGRATVIVRSARHPEVLLAAAARFCPPGGAMTVSWNGVDCLAERGGVDCGAKLPVPGETDPYDVTISCVLARGRAC